jgi:hypothetical protein
VRKNQDAYFCIIVCLKIWADYCVFMFTHCGGAAEITVKSWQLVTAIHDAGDGLIVCDDTD